ncbi:hypothetical protein LUZ60_002730 [Juncus effusus]|nr:hypothetical protein LUZ60_002730 [Juncus effusus]
MKETWRFVVERRPVALLIATLFVLTFLIIFFENDRATWRGSHLGDNDVVEDSSSITATAFLPNNKFLGGLLSCDFDEQSCLSRYQTFLYRKQSDHILSSYLVTKLRKYEYLHRKCGPGTTLFKKSLEQLKSNHSTDQLECNYVIWSPFGGLGNRMLTIASTFLYALLTNRVMLIDHSVDLIDLFCEPFPDSSWILPPNFPIKDFEPFGFESNQSYGYMLMNNLISENPNIQATTLPPFVYVHLQFSYVWNGLHKLFFCDNNQFALRKFNWMLIKSDNYFVPGLFMISQYKEELDLMFPSKETVFHHLGRYLFHPSNPVWEITMSHYNSSLVKAKEKFGIQIRDFMWSNISTENRFDQIMNCTHMENILPTVNLDQANNPSSNKIGSNSKSVLITSLSNDYYKKMVQYYRHPTINDEQVHVYQPSHEGNQILDNFSHDEKALSEIILLSFSDVLVTSAWSTFGYVSYGLAGTRPWILLSRRDGMVPDPPCVRVISIEPCFHTPPNFDCKNKKDADTGRMVRYVRHCQDVSEGIQLVD